MGEGLLKTAKDLLPQASAIAVLSDEAVYQRYGRFLPGDPIFVPSGEEAKSLETAIHCWEELQKHHFDRDALIVALGGGSIGDLTGFVAATYLRGIRWAFVPTTLLAMVDSSIGGKTGINFGGVKNTLGAIHRPETVIADPITLVTLPERERRSGMAEIIKHGVIQDPDLLEHLSPLPIEQSIAVKAAIVIEDEREKGARALLNYGHTFGHALESLCEDLLHGEAVSIGMSCAAHLGKLLGLCDDTFIEKQDTICQDANLPTKLPWFEMDDLLAKMRQDKKVRGGKLRFVLPIAFGQVEIHTATPEQVRASIEEKRVWDGRA